MEFVFFALALTIGTIALLSGAAFVIYMGFTVGGMWGYGGGCIAAFLLGCAFGSSDWR